MRAFSFSALALLPTLFGPVPIEPSRRLIQDDALYWTECQPTAEISRMDVPEYIAILDSAPAVQVYFGIPELLQRRGIERRRRTSSYSAPSLVGSDDRHDRDCGYSRAARDARFVGGAGGVVQKIGKGFDGHDVCRGSAVVDENNIDGRWTRVLHGLTGADFFRPPCRFADVRNYLVNIDESPFQSGDDRGGFFRRFGGQSSGPCQADCEPGENSGERCEEHGRAGRNVVMVASMNQPVPQRIVRMREVGLFS
jgi:hypothetical protein